MKNLKKSTPMCRTDAQLLQLSSLCIHIFVWDGISARKSKYNDYAYLYTQQRAHDSLFHFLMPYFYFQQFFSFKDIMLHVNKILTDTRVYFLSLTPSNLNLYWDFKILITDDCLQLIIIFN